MDERTKEQTNWQAEKTKHGTPMAVLHDAEQRDIVKVYLSPDRGTLRIVLSELAVATQVKVDVENHLIDFRRRP